MMRLDSDPVGAKRCQECESHVTPEFRRGYGDQDDVAHRCRRCDTAERLSQGSAAGLEVVLADPLDDPTRFNSTLEDLPTRVRSAVESRVIATDGGEDA
ncbi:hypothetical protein OB905_13080 [Halobacteria archaeon AArc-dxtr1]|nr:hypothetical protein [Halobacteria archaeon AArc-dxtr1]